MPYKDPKAGRRAYYKAHSDDVKARAAAWNAAHPEERRARDAAYYRANAEAIKARVAERRRTNPSVRQSMRLVDNLRRRLNKALRGISKSARTLALLGCTLDELRSHLEAQFKPGMTWENYGYRGWHVDHIRPCSNFDLSDPEQQRQCFHFTNLQPLWAELNLKKAASVATTI
jgi:hypothetical protein